MCDSMRNVDKDVCETRSMFYTKLPLLHHTLVGWAEFSQGLPTLLRGKMQNFRRKQAFKIVVKKEVPAGKKHLFVNMTGLQLFFWGGGAACEICQLATLSPSLSLSFLVWILLHLLLLFAFFLLLLLFLPDVKSSMGDGS